MFNIHTCSCPLRLSNSLGTFPLKPEIDQDTIVRTGAQCIFLKNRWFGDWHISVHRMYTDVSMNIQIYLFIKSVYQFHFGAIGRLCLFPKRILSLLASQTKQDVLVAITNKTRWRNVIEILSIIQPRRAPSSLCAPCWGAWWLFHEGKESGNEDC
jgi:hypothetical protein